MRGIGAVRALNTRKLRFRGAYASYERALANVRSGALAGYDHDGISALHEELKERVHVWDYPILYWLQRLAPETTRIIDAGGHTGVKYRAFSRHLDLKRIDWIVFDLPTMVKAGRAQARPEDSSLSFVERIEEAPSAEILLASGLLQYLNEPFVDLVRRMRTPPRYMLLNKVATRDGPTVVTLENFGFAEVPYHIRSQDEIPRALDALGYEIVDHWIIPSLAHEIPTHPELGYSVSRGYFARVRQ